MAEDWFHTFEGKLTNRAFIEAVTEARRKSKFFPTETDVIEAGKHNRKDRCDNCQYNQDKSELCRNLSKPGFDPSKCGSFVRVER